MAARMTYKKAGVDIHAASIFKSKIKSLVRSSFRQEVLRDIGGFGSFFKLPVGYKEPVLVSSADGVGTKLTIATLAAKHDTVGVDAVAMNVNDILCTGAEPLFFLDYIAHSNVSQRVLIDVVKGLNAGCVEAGCSLIGGETAQMPGVYADGEYDIAGFCVGVVERRRIIDGRMIRAGDAIIGLESNGLHSNGFSLVRKVLTLAQQKKMSRELLRPTRIYVRPVLGLLRARQAGLQDAVRGISHITGGGFYDKIARIMPAGLSACIEKDSWLVPPIFQVVAKQGNIGFEEMYRTLNMGIGLVLMVRKEQVNAVLGFLGRQRLHSWVIGNVCKGSDKVSFTA